jgi:hypothetical protein
MVKTISLCLGFDLSGFSCASDFEPKETSLRFLFQVVSGTRLSLKITWFQAMLFSDGLYAVRVPLILPDYVVPLETELASIIKLTCIINTGTPHPVVVGQFNNTMKVGGWVQVLFQSPFPFKSHSTSPLSGSQTHIS